MTQVKAVAEYKNKMVKAEEVNGVYIIKGFTDGEEQFRFETKDMWKSIRMYGFFRDEMYEE